MSTPSSNEQRVRDLVTQQSADWFVANRGGLSHREREAFVNWLRASPVHVEEYLAVAGIDRDLRTAGAAARDSIEAIVARARAPEGSSVGPPGSGWRLRWPAVAAAMAGLAVVCLAALFAWHARPQSPSAPVLAAALHFSAGHGEQASYRLADGSVLHLNTDSAVTVRYSEAERRVVLESGEADFEVVRRQGRPFRVIAGPAETVDLGTRFDVRLADGAALVTVQEGRVAVALVAADGAGARFVTLGTDQQIRVTAGELPVAPTAVDSQRTTSWLHRQIVFEREPLARVAAEFNRYARKPIEIATPALKNLEISGVFATDDSEAFVAFLRSLDNVRVEETARVIRVSQK